MPPRPTPLRPVPHLVATGFTTALLGDERTLREFVVGDDVVRTVLREGQPAALLLVNDSYDPLDERQLRIGVEKDPKRIRQFEHFCGRPIAEVPDPFECHSSYSDHFLQALRERLARLDIHPVVLDAHLVYRGGHYAPYIEQVFERYEEIQTALVNEFGATSPELFRVQCVRCSCIDATTIRSVEHGQVAYRCKRCAAAPSQSVSDLRGKLSWKLDCAARWNLYRIDTETFSKPHLSEQGTWQVAKSISRLYFGGRIPATVRYGDLHVSRECSGRLLDMLPPEVFKAMLLEHRTRDLDLTREHVETFCRKYQVRQGTSYVDFVRRELPQRALEVAAGTPSNGARPHASRGPGTDAWVPYANEFSQFFYGKRHGLRPLDRQQIERASPVTLEATREVVACALALRADPEITADTVKQRVRAHLASRETSPAVYPFLRHVLGQSEGPNVATLLAILPQEILESLELVLAAATGVLKSEGRGEDPPEEMDTLAA